VNRYWLWWFIITFPVGFLIPEGYALATAHPEWTLSYAVWNLEHFQAGQSPLQWNFAHFAFTAVFSLITLWLIGHFGWGLWR
jgi:hypothetical protein